MRSNKFWIIVLAVVLVVSGVIWLMLPGGGGSSAHIYIDGEPAEIIDLSSVEEPYSFTVECDGGYNVISVEHGRICVSEADCPDGACVRQGWLSGGAAPIVCLPHRLVIQIGSGVSPDVDAVAR